MRAAAVLLPALVLAACGGGDNERRSAAAPNTELLFATPASSAPGTSTYSWKPAGKLVPIDKKSTPAPAALAAATSDEAAFAFRDEEGEALANLELRPVRGKGYPELRVVLKARRIGDTAAASAISPACSSDTRCEYQLSKKYAVTLGDDKSLRLVARDGFIAVLARELAYDVPRAVELRITADGGLLTGRRILVLTED